MSHTIEVTAEPPQTRKRPAQSSRTSLAKRRVVRRWLDQTEWLVASFAVLFLIGYAVPILDVHISRGWKDLCSALVWGTYGAFAVEYMARVWSARKRRQYFLGHIPDLLIVALPILKPLRLLRLVVLFRVVNRKAAAALQGRVPLYVGVSTGVLVFCAALAVLDAERGQPGSNIHTFGSAIWWAMVTITTVGYGDYFPVTVEGRCVAVGLMLGGIALIGVVTASFAAWFISRVTAEEAEEQAATRATST